MAALPSLERDAVNPATREIALLPQEKGERRVTISVDNLSQIQCAYGDAAIAAVAAAVDLVVGQLRVGQCSARTPKPGLIELAFGPQTAQQAAGILEAAAIGLTSHPVRLDDLSFHLALTCPALAGAGGLTSSSSVPVRIPAVDDEDWAARYRCDMAIAADALAAVAEGRLDLVWQPVRSASSPEYILYHEGLARPCSPNGEPLSPGLFIPALERLGLVRAFDRNVVAQALDELEHFRSARLGVNISAQSARLDGWWSSLLARLRAAPSVARRLVIEITETAALASDAPAFVAELRSLGCRIALDDFGVGHASIRSAMALNPDIIKIDAFFLQRAGACEHGEAMLEHLIGLAAHSAATIIVEGVETAGQSLLAERLQGRYASPGSVACWQQGYHLGQPSFWREWRYEALDEPQVVPLHHLAMRAGRALSSMVRPCGESRMMAARPDREPLLFTTLDLSHVAPAPRLAAEEAGIVLGLFIAVPLSLGLWALLWMLA